MAAGIIKLTVDHTKIDADQTNIPVAFNLTTSCGTGSYDATAFFTELSTAANRKKVKIYRSDHSTQCYAEIEPGYDFTTKKIVYHVLAPSVSSTVDEVFYLDYDSAFADNATYIGDTGVLTTASITGDDFTGADSDPADPDLWRTYEDGESLNIQSNKLNFSITSAVAQPYIQSKLLLSGDFDIQVDFDLATAPATNIWLIGFDLISLAGDTISIDIRYNSSKQYYSYITGDYSTSGTTDTSGKMRITRSSGTFNTYYWDGSWQLLQTKAAGVTEDIVVKLRSQTTSSMSFEANIDNFVINSGTAKESVASKVWDNDFELVYHCAQDPSGGAGAILDSTTSWLNGTPSGSMTSGDLIDGPIGKALDFDGSDDYIDIQHDGTVANEPDLTITAMAKYKTMGTERPVYDESAAGGTVFRLTKKSTDKLNFSFKTSGSFYDADGATTISVDTYYLMSGRLSSSSGMSVLLNGVSDGTDTNTSPCDESISYSSVARYLNAGYYAHIDTAEVRLSRSARSDAWIKATSYSLKDDLLLIELGEFPFDSGSFILSGTAVILKYSKLSLESASYNLTGTAITFARTYVGAVESGEFNISAPQTSLIRFNEILPGWRSYKGSGVWDFEEQPNKWGYLNNPRWTNTPEAPVQYDQNPLEEPQIWEPYKSSKASDFDNTNHVVCGHWHKRPISDEDIWEGANIYGLFINESSLWGVYFNGSALTYSGKYESPDKDINGLILYENNLLVVAGDDDTSEIRVINSVPTNQLFTLIQSYEPFNNYDIRDASECSLTNGRTDTEYIYLDEKGSLVIIDAHIKQTRTSYGTSIVGSNGLHYWAKRSSWGPHPIDEDYWDTWWAPVGDANNEYLNTYGVGSCYAVTGDWVEHITVGNYIYIAIWQSARPHLRKFNLSTFEVEADNTSQIFRRLYYYNGKIYATAGTFGVDVLSYSALDLSATGESIHLTGYLGDLCECGGYIIAVTQVYTGNAGVYKLDPNDLSIVDSIISTNSYKECIKVNDPDDKYVVLGGSTSISILDVTTMTIIDSIVTDIGFNQQYLLVKNN